MGKVNHEIRQLFVDKRIALGLSIEELAKRVGKSPLFIMKMELGILALNSTNLGKFCRALGLDKKYVDSEDENLENYPERLEILLRRRVVEGISDMSARDLKRMLILIDDFHRRGDYSDL